MKPSLRIKRYVQQLLNDFSIFHVPKRNGLIGSGLKQRPERGIDGTPRTCTERRGREKLKKVDVKGKEMGKTNLIKGLRTRGTVPQQWLNKQKHFRGKEVMGQKAKDIEH